MCRRFVRGPRPLSGDGARRFGKTVRLFLQTAFSSFSERRVPLRSVPCRTRAACDKERKAETLKASPAGVGKSAAGRCAFAVARAGLLCMAERGRRFSSCARAMPRKSVSRRFPEADAPFCGARRSFP